MLQRPQKTHRKMVIHGSIDDWDPGTEESLCLNDRDGSELSALASLDGHKLANLKRFCGVVKQTTITTEATWRKLFGKTPNLESLKLTSLQCNGEWEDKVLSQVCSVLLETDASCAFRESLQVLYVNFSCHCYENLGTKTQHLWVTQRLVLQVFPLFPNLRTVQLRTTFLENHHIVAIAKAISIAETDPGLSNTNLVSLNLNGIHLDGPASEWIEPQEPTLSVREALLMILQSNVFPGLYHIGRRVLCKDYTNFRELALVGGKLPPQEGRFLDIEGQLLINHAGRFRFQTRSIPRSLWPIVLERAYRGSYRVYGVYPKQIEADRDALRNATGLYDLLRNCDSILHHLIEVFRV